MTRIFTVTLAFSLFAIICGGAVYSSLTRKRTPTSRRRSREDCKSPNNVHRAGPEFFETMCEFDLLPDDILVSIIARLPTRDGVRTSILSNRWRNLYKFTPCFQLHCVDLVRHVADRDSLSRNSIEILLRLISSHRSKIHSFDLTCCLTPSTNHLLKQCIHQLGKSGVEKLDLCFSCSSYYVYFPCHLLSYLPSLKRLTLCSCALPPDLYTKYHSLQTLILCHSIASAGFVKCVLSNCLSLASLSIISCSCPRKLSFRGAPLKTLAIDSCRGEYEKIELHLENLSEFVFKSRGVATLLFDHVPRLRILSVSFETVNTMPYAFGQLPNHVPHIEFLTVGTRAELYQDRISDAMRFRNLRRLDIDVFCTYKSDLLTLAPYLERCPLLEELHLNLIKMGLYTEGVKSKPMAKLHHKLKRVKISGFRGTDNEMDFAIHILKSAVELKGLWIVEGRVPWSEPTLERINGRMLQYQSITSMLSSPRFIKMSF